MIWTLEMAMFRSLIYIYSSPMKAGLFCLWKIILNRKQTINASYLRSYSDVTYSMPTFPVLFILSPYQFFLASYTYAWNLQMRMST